MSNTLAGACPSCANPAVAGDSFCENCGALLSPLEPSIEAPTSSCSGCGSELPPAGDGDGYCDVCGRREPDPRDHVEAGFPGAAAVSDKGRRRHNQDAFALWTEPDGRVAAVVCDGVSTSSRPEEAAQRAAIASLAALRTSTVFDAYAAALDAVADVRWDRRQDHAGPPACTMLAATVAGDRVQLLSVGDCRGFWLPDHGQPAILTVDDSWPAEQVAAGSMTAEEAYADHRSHVITRWVGVDADADWQPQCVDFLAQGPGRLVLCSDGLWNYATTAPELSTAAGAGNALAVARRLVDFAVERGGHDNVTVVVVDLPVSPTGPDDLMPKGPTP